MIQRASRLVDQFYVCISHNDVKSTLFAIQQRVEWVSKTVDKTPLFYDVKIIQFNDLLVDLVKRLNATFIIRGLRNAADYDFEAQLSHANKKLTPETETILLSAQDYPFISSSIVKSIFACGGEISEFVPKQVAESLSQNRRF